MSTRAWPCKTPGCDVTHPVPSLAEECAARRRADLEAAVAEAYTPEARETWWRAWERADESQRYGMEHGVLAEWSGQR